MSDSPAAKRWVLPGADTTRTTILKSQARDRSYQSLEPGPGEPHRRRYELASDRGPAWDGQAEPLARLIHITDFQLADLASPSRVEFLQRRQGEPEWRRMLPAYRPQEFMLTQAVESIVRTVRRVADESDVDFVVTTGDNTDSAQENELVTYLTLMDGGEVDPGWDNHGLAETVTCSDDPAYWNPNPGTPSIWKQEYGFPDYAHAVAASARKFTGAGLGTPWLACLGNHDCLVQGRAKAPEGYNDFLTGNRKPVSSPAKPYAGEDALNDYIADPLWLSQGASATIEASPFRRFIEKREYVERHFETTTEPIGHGFTVDNLKNGTAYYIYDNVPGMRIITLDTTNREGHVDGCINDAQYIWLEARLQEVHSLYSAPDGTEVLSGNEDRIVVLCSHHGLSTLTNGTAYPDGETLHLAPDMENLLQRYPNVVLWLSGHTHVNRITANTRPSGKGGFWEVSTSSIAEWPVQLRTVEFSVIRDAGLLIRTTMIDSAAPITPTGGTELADLASLHREAAANDPGSVGGPMAEGRPEDRNTDLFVPLSPSTLAAAISHIRSVDCPGLDGANT